MIPFTSSMLCSRPGRNSIRRLCIIEPPGLTCRTNSADGIIISIPGTKMNTEVSAENKDISPAEWILLETLDCRPNRPLHTGPFLTVQRRRRRRKYVRTYLFKDPTLIDDLSSYQTNFVLDRINNWAFNAFILDNVTGGRPLPNLCVHLFKTYGLLEHFNLDPVIVWKLFSIIEDGYHWRNPYHNAVHAADVTQAMHCFLQEHMILEKLTHLEILSAVLAAVVHDLDHPGVNQPFLIATSNHLAALYKNSSVLENHHWRSAMGCLNESGVSSVLGPEQVLEVEEQIRSLVLATDITRQQEFLTKLKNYLDTDTLDMNLPEVRHFVLQIALKCADICNPCRPWDISRKWSMKVCEEFFRQGDYERQLNLPVTSLCDRYSTSVPKIQTGFFTFVVQPLFTEWHRMMHTPLSSYMMGNLETNKKKWDQLMQDELAHDTQETSEGDESEIPQHLIEDSDTISISVAVIAARNARRNEECLVHHGSNGSTRSVRFDPLTTITTASDSENSDEGDDQGSPLQTLSRRFDRGGNGTGSSDTDFLGIPRPDGRRHSIATGLMGSNITLPPQMLSSMGGMGSHSGSSLALNEIVSPASSTRMVGRTVIRRESLPSGSLLSGRALPSKTILHLQRLSSKSISEQGTSSSAGSSTTGATAGSGSPDPVSPIKSAQTSAAEKSSCSSCSTTDEILDFTYSLPESGSPRRTIMDATDLDELCPGTSILSMSPNVAHVTLQQSADLEDQRRHLIRQQTCPVVSLHAAEGGGNFNRPRFLSAAAAVSPTAVASSSIISQHRSRNRSPETSANNSGGEEQGIGRGSGGSSSEALICEVISEEVDRQSGGSSAEASPLEIFVQQFPPVSDDNDGEAPRRGSDTDRSESIPAIEGPSVYDYNSYDRSNYSFQDGEVGGSAKFSRYYEHDDSLQYEDEDRLVDDDEEDEDSYQQKAQSNFTANFHNPSFTPEDQVQESGSRQPRQIVVPDRCDRQAQTTETVVEEFAQAINPIVSSEAAKTSSSLTLKPSSKTFSTATSSTQTDSSCEKENVDPIEASLLADEIEASSPACISSNQVSASSSNRLATILMWRNNRLWKSLTEEEPDETPCSDMDPEENLADYYERWDVRVTQQIHQGVMGARLQMRRGSAPTTSPNVMGCRGSQDRRSDPTQYHSTSILNPEKTNFNLVNNNPAVINSGAAFCEASASSPYAKQSQLRRGSAPVDLLRQTILRPIAPSNKQCFPRMGRRGSLPIDSTSSESTYAYKWMHVFPYSEDDSHISLKRRSSGGPELFAAAQQKVSTSMSSVGAWKAQILIEQMSSNTAAASTSCGFWPGRRRGSLPVDVYIAASGSCSSESESSAGDTSDT